MFGAAMVITVETAFAISSDTGLQLVSCDLRDLVDRGLAVTPRQAVDWPDG